MGVHYFRPPCPLGVSREDNLRSGINRSQPQPGWTLAAVGLGSNVGDRRAHLDAAVNALVSTNGIRVVAVSKAIETPPVGPVHQPSFLNGAVVLETSLRPRALLSVLLDVERSRGRDRAREQRWGPRTLDLDLLLYGSSSIDEPGLTVPHPRMHERRFVLEPLAEIAPDWIVPGLDQAVGALRDALKP